MSVRRGRLLRAAGLLVYAAGAISVLATDAAINPGNSGGPLLDLEGRVIGITSGLISGMGESVGVNFAIPVNTAKELLPQLRSGSVVHGWIGVAVLRLTPSGARALGLQPPVGLIVIDLARDGPAAQAGLRVADIIVGIVGERRVPAEDVDRYIMRARPGSTVGLLVYRKGKPVEVPVVVGARPRPAGTER